MVEGRSHVVSAAVGGGNPAGRSLCWQAREPQRPANSLRPRYTYKGVASHPDLVKPASALKPRSSAGVGLSGVRGGGACVIDEPGTWEARFGVSLATRGQPWVGNHNRLWGRVRASERFIVARKRGNARGAKGPWPESSRVRDAGSGLNRASGSMTDYNCQRGDRSWAAGPSGIAVHALWKRRLRREPDAGNPHVRFDEGEGCDGHWLRPFNPSSLSTLLSIRCAKQVRCISLSPVK
jgi:hypothetical protein